MRTATVLAFAGLFLLGGLVAAYAEDEPFPAGTSSHELHGLRCSIVMPTEFDVSAEHSLMVVLHGAGGTETGMASALEFLTKDDFVVVAPKSRGQTWAAKDLADVRAIVKDLTGQLNIGERRLHGAGFSNGGWNLGPVALDSELRFQSATWIAAGFQGGKLPKHAKEMGILALAGAEDGNRDAAEGTPEKTREDVRMAEVRIQPDLGHKWPRELMPYYGWWLGVQEGRYVPGQSMAFEWTESRDTALAALPESKAGGIEYWYSAEDAENEQARFLQNDVLQDFAVRHFGGQLTAWKLDASEHAETFAALKIKATPAIVVYDKKGKPKKTLTGKIKASSLARALKSVARNKKLPD